MRTLLPRGRVRSAGLAAAFVAAVVFPSLGPGAQAQTQSTLEQMHSVADVVESVAPSVVNIFTRTEVRMQGNGRSPLSDDLFRRFFGELPDGFGGRQSTQPQQSLGSGVVYTADGLIVTNNHVVRLADEIRVSLQDGREFDAEVIGTDEASDLALLRIDADDLAPVRWGDSVGLRVGDGVLAVGNPFGLGETVTQGIVSAKGRSVRMLDYEDFIQTDASINPGNSGGPLVNLRGEVVGINTAILSRSGGSQGIGFAIPGYLVERVIGSLRDHGRVVRGYLGIVPQQLTPALARAAQVDANRGVLVSQVLEDSPASRSGFRQGDVIVAMNREEVVSMPVFRTAIGHLPPGESVSFELLRDGKRQTLRVELGERPSSAVASGGTGPGPIDLGGFEVRDADRRLAARLGLESDVVGPVVTSVEPASAAQRAGLRAGDLIIEVARVPVADAAEVRTAVVRAMEEQEGDAPLLLLIERQGTTMYLALGPLEG